MFIFTAYVDRFCPLELSELWLIIIVCCFLSDLTILRSYEDGALANERAANWSICLALMAFEEGWVSCCAIIYIRFSGLSKGPPLMTSNVVLWTYFTPINKGLINIIKTIKFNCRVSFVLIKLWFTSEVIML